MTKKFVLSEKRKELFKKYFKESSEVELTELLEEIEYKIEQQDKEFIRLLKIKFNSAWDDRIIDKLAGEKLR